MPYTRWNLDLPQIVQHDDSEVHGQCEWDLNQTCWKLCYHCQLVSYLTMIIKGMQAYHDGVFCSQYVVKWFNCASLEVMQYYVVKPWLTTHSASRWFRSTSVWMRFKSNMLKIVLSLPTCELFLYAWFMIIKGMQAYHDGFFCSQYVVKWFIRSASRWFRSTWSSDAVLRGETLTYHA